MPIISVEKLNNANLDAETIEQVVNGEPNVLVESREGRKIPTLATFGEKHLSAGVILYGEKTQEQVNDEVGNALTGLSFANKTYSTVAAANADIANIAVNQSVWVSSATEGGLYEKKTADATSVVKSNYDPVLLGEQKSEEKLQTIREAIISKNLYDSSKAVYGSRLSGTGLLTNIADSKRTGYIPVVAGQTYTLSWSNSPASAQLSYAFFTSETELQGTNYTTVNNTTLKYTFTVPSGVNFLVVNLKQSASTVERLNVQIELGESATIYEPFGLKYVIKNDALPNNIVDDEKLSEAVSSKISASDVPEIVAPLLVKDYEINIISKNLFNEADLLVDRYLSTVNGGVIISAGWLCSGFIPVEAGKQYTLSGARARQGISFLAKTVIDGSAALLYDNTSTLPLTVTAPAGANYAVIALESPTAKGYSNIQFEEGSQATAYTPYGYKEQLLDGSKVNAITLAQISDLDPSRLDTKAELSLINGSGSVKNGDLEIGLRVFNTVNYDGSAVFNFSQDKYKGNVVRINGDDSAPVRMMGATVGANHGYSRTILTLANHGKTNDDVGSVWTNGAYQWVILQIISSSQLSVTCRTLNIAFPLGNTLTHISGAANTESFTPTAISAKQWYPMLKNHKVDLILDNNVHNELNLESGFNDSLKISESYDLMEKADIVEWLILNGGKEVTSYSAASACNVSHTHTFNSDLTDVISANFFVYKNLSAARDLMFTQSAPLEPVDNELLYYVPRSIPFVHESVNYDFSKPTDVANLNITTRIDFTVARTEVDAVLPDRLVMLAGDLGYASGYLPVLDAAPDVRNTLTSKGIQISEARDTLGRPSPKLYPYLVDGLTTLQSGANYSCVAYRAYFNRPSVAARTVQYDVQHGNEVYLFLDWHSGDFVDIVELKPYLHGRSFEVVEKTDNITLLSKVSSNNVAVNVGSVISNARLILKFT